MCRYWTELSCDCYATFVEDTAQNRDLFVKLFMFVWPIYLVFLNCLKCLTQNRINTARQTIAIFFLASSRSSYSGQHLATFSDDFYNLYDDADLTLSEGEIFLSLPHFHE